MFRHRVRILSAVLIAATCAVLLRLAQLQLWRHELYVAARDHQGRPRAEPLAPKRGEIADRDGRVLAADVPSFDLAVRADKLKLEALTLEEVREARRRARDEAARKTSFAALALRLARDPWVQGVAAQAARSPAELSDGLLDALDRVARGWERPSTPVVFLHGMDPAAWTALRAAQEDEFFAPGAGGLLPAATFAPRHEPPARFPGLVCRSSVRREYPRGTYLAHVLGTLGELQPAQLAQLRARGTLVDRLAARERYWSRLQAAWTPAQLDALRALLAADPRGLSVEGVLAALRELDEPGRRQAVALGLEDVLRWSDAPPRIALGETERFWLGEDLEALLRRAAPATLPDLRLGESGVEAYYNQRLRGESGLRLALGAARNLDETGLLERDVAARPGDALRLTISEAWQRAAEGALASQERPGALVVLDCASGEVLALASFPTFDPNLFVPPREGQARQAALQALLADERQALLNRASANHYPLGSVMKVLIAAAALEEGSIGPGQTICCDGYLVEGGRRFHCDGAHAHGLVDLDHALRRSCNVYFFKAGGRLGAERIAVWAHALGLGRRTGLDLPAEAGGVIPDKAWRARALPDLRWSLGKDYLLAIGQGYMNATPLQAACLLASVANGGRPVAPRLWADAPPQAPAAPILSARTLDPIRKGLYEAVNVGIPGQMGTAFRAFHQGVEPLPFRVAGKTGTADVTGNKTPHAWFAGYAPAERPRVAFCVFVENGGHGGDVAAPLAYRMLKEVAAGPEASWLTERSR
ncbi:MAG: penicillin-binding transpeptidase domain-containing protein [Planctomycetota bacterium]|nr:penicillin-binding transpeptidase domain-containing protein [Planctomycetota bacterium]